MMRVIQWRDVTTPGLAHRASRASLLLPSHSLETTLRHLYFTQHLTVTDICVEIETLSDCCFSSERSLSQLHRQVFSERFFRE